MSDQHFDVVVIGAGPAGEGAAINAAKNGSRVAIVDDKQTVGATAPIGQPFRPRLCAIP